MCLTHATWFNINDMLTIRGFSNPKKLFLKDDTSSYLVVVKICWQGNIQGHFQAVFTQCDHGVKSLRSRTELMQLYRTVLLRLQQSLVCVFNGD